MDEQLQELWEQHERTPFPAGCHGKTFQGVSLALLNSEAGGAIMSRLAAGDNLSSRQRSVLVNSKASIAKIRDELPSEEAKTYFDNLAQMITLALGTDS